MIRAALHNCAIIHMYIYLVYECLYVYQCISFCFFLSARYTCLWVCVCVCCTVEVLYIQNTNINRQNNNVQFGAKRRGEWKGGGAEEVQQTPKKVGRSKRGRLDWR